LKPAQILDGFVRAFNSFVNGVLHRGGGGAGKLDEFVNVVFHIRLFWEWSNFEDCSSKAVMIYNHDLEAFVN
jgi:hypothetical protein